MNENNPKGALMFVRDCGDYGVISPMYRERVMGSSKACVLADSEDAKNYAARNNLLLVDREVKP